MRRGVNFKVPLVALMLLSALTTTRAQNAPWQPRKPVELITMSAAGGASDKAAHVMVEIIKKHQLAPVTITHANKESPKNKCFRRRSLPLIWDT
jgi:tripartite-type tricarboxylate transporter receptor subunit TctC